MIEGHPEIHARERMQHQEISTCHECRRSFRAKTEDQFCMQLCNDCFIAHMNLREPVISVHVQTRPHGRALR
jgi:hypothetical protein